MKKCWCSFSPWRQGGRRSHDPNPAVPFRNTKVLRGARHHKDLRHYCSTASYAVFQATYSCKEWRGRNQTLSYVQLSEADNGQKDHLRARWKYIKCLTSGPSRVGRVRLPGRGFRDPPKGWLKNEDDLAKSCSRWHSWIGNIYASHRLFWFVILGFFCGHMIFWFILQYHSVWYNSNQN